MSLGLIEPAQKGCAVSSTLDPIGADGAVYSERFIEVEAGVELRIMEWVPRQGREDEIILFVAGWISLVDGWADLLRGLVPRWRVVYLETREKHSARIRPDRLCVESFSVSRLADDLVTAAEMLELDMGRVALLGSSLGANTILEALKNRRLEARAAFLVNPNTHFSFPWWAPAVIHLPRLVHTLAKRLVATYLRHRRVDSKRDPAQMKRYEKTLMAADPIRLKLSACAVRSYVVWPGLETIATPVALAYASSDTLHGEADVRAIADRLPLARPLPFSSNTAMHSDAVVPELERFLAETGEA